MTLKSKEAKKETTNIRNLWLMKGKCNINYLHVSWNYLDINLSLITASVLFIFYVSIVNHSFIFAFTFEIICLFSKMFFSICFLFCFKYHPIINLLLCTSTELYFYYSTFSNWSMKRKKNRWQKKEQTNWQSRKHVRTSTFSCKSYILSLYDINQVTSLFDLITWQQHKYNWFVSKLWDDFEQWLIFVCKFRTNFKENLLLKLFIDLNIDLSWYITATTPLTSLSTNKSDL